MTSSVNVGSEVKYEPRETKCMNPTLSVATKESGMNAKGLDQLGRCRSDHHGYSAAPRSEGPKRVGRGCAELASRSEPEGRGIGRKWR